MPRRMASYGDRADNGLASDQDLTRVGPAISGQDLEELVLALGLESGDAEDLAGRSVRETPLTLPPGRGGGSRAPPVARPRERAGPPPRRLPPRRPRRASPPPACASPPSPGASDSTLRPLRRMVARSHSCRTSVSRWVMNRTERPSDFPVPHDGEHVLRLVGGQGSGDLVEEQQMGVLRQRPGQVEQAEDREREVLDGGVEVERPEVHPIEPLQHGVGVDPGEPQVLVDGEVGDQRRVLEHGGQPGTGGVGGAVSRFASTPLTATVPLSAANTPERILTMVLFPAPLAPSRAWISPGMHGEVHRSQGDDRAIALGDGPRSRAGGTGRSRMALRRRPAPHGRPPMVGDRAPTRDGRPALAARFRSAAHRCCRPMTSSAARTSCTDRSPRRCSTRRLGSGT